MAKDRPEKKSKKIASNLGDYLGKSPGRPKGTPNKNTQWLKAALLGPFDEVAFKKWVKENPTDYFTKVVPKFIPAKVEGDLNLNVSNMSDDELRDRISGMLAKLGVNKSLPSPE
jgi:hypothetical protein